MSEKQIFTNPKGLLLKTIEGTTYTAGENIDISNGVISAYNDTFVAVKGKTKFSEITDAIDKGKAVFAVKDGTDGFNYDKTYMLLKKTSTEYEFMNTATEFNDNHKEVIMNHRVAVDSSDRWYHSDTSTSLGDSNICLEFYNNGSYADIMSKISAGKCVIVYKDNSCYMFYTTMQYGTDEEGYHYSVVFYRTILVGDTIRYLLVTLDDEDNWTESTEYFSLPDMPVEIIEYNKANYTDIYNTLMSGKGVVCIAPLHSSYGVFDNPFIDSTNHRIIFQSHRMRLDVDEDDKRSFKLFNYQAIVGSDNGWYLTNNSWSLEEPEQIDLKVFVAEYDVTTYDEIKAAVNSGKTVVVNRQYSGGMMGPYAFYRKSFDDEHGSIYIWYDSTTTLQTTTAGKKRIVTGNYKVQCSEKLGWENTYEVFYGQPLMTAGTGISISNDNTISTNLKTINGSSIEGSGNISIPTHAYSSIQGTLQINNVTDQMESNDRGITTVYYDGWVSRGGQFNAINGERTSWGALASKEIALSFPPSLLKYGNNITLSYGSEKIVKYFYEADVRPLTSTSSNYSLKFTVPDSWVGQNVWHTYYGETRSEITITSYFKLEEETHIDKALELAKETSVSKRLDLKQNILVSGANIKTINGSSIVGSGDLTVTASLTPSNVKVNKQITLYAGSVKQAAYSTGYSLPANKTFIGSVIIHSLEACEPADLIGLGIKLGSDAAAHYFADGFVRDSDRYNSFVLPLNTTIGDTAEELFIIFSGMVPSQTVDITIIGISF